MRVKLAEVLLAVTVRLTCRKLLVVRFTARPVSDPEMQLAYVALGH